MQANHNNVENATNEYLDNPQSTKSTAFNIQSADELPSVSHVNSVAPTRPPSRTNNGSPLEGPTNTTQEDADLARAIAESAAESGITPQEVGVMDHETSSKYFGPANRTEYDSEMWAMVPTKTMVEAEAADPAPSSRKRERDAPAFLRQSKDNRLGAIISIYSKIPLARNFLLRCGRPAPTYGYNTEWWKGKPILRQDVLAKMARGEDVGGEDAHPDFIDELHRLVAFLDKSERCYANSDSLSETKAIAESFDSWVPDIEERLFQALQDIGTENPDSGVEQLITIGKITTVLPPSPNQFDSDGQADEEDETNSFIFLNVSLDSDTYSWVNTLYDALDNLLWSAALSLDSPFPYDAKTAVLLKPAEVLTIRLGGSGLVKPCEIPAVFYADRYMDSHKDLALRFQTQIREIKIALKKLALVEEERVNCTGQLCGFNLQGLSHKHDVRECCTKIIAYAEQLLKRQKRDTQWRQFQDQWQKGTPYSMDDLRLIHTWSGSSRSTHDENVNQEKWEHIVQVCKDKIDEVGHTLSEYEQKRKELNMYLDVVRKRLTCQEYEVDNDLFVFRSDRNAYHPEYWNPSTKYLLRGVATTFELAYVCTRDVEDLTSPGEGSGVRDQWWEVGYVKSDSSPVRARKVTLDDVLFAAGTEAKSPILVYASEAALNQEQIPLSDALRMFVKADNRSFQQELVQEESIQETKNQLREAPIQDQTEIGVTAAALAQIPSEPRGKRKHSIGSSVATNGSVRSDLADVDLIFEFDAPAPIDQYNGSRSSRPSSVVESLAKCEAHGYDVLGFDEKRGGKYVENQDNDNGSDAGAASTHKMPEMSERKRGGNPFLARPGNSVQNSTDLMDLDTDQEPEVG
ncbi:hypothetical protein ONZ43_g1126 [Nemania bipapillata]|uniref:Uncharacterized protein n=1 Tax=Nemania bipapillata TaxID=110536 RepID=A0ACC2J6F4_9PEZI|nr:hypothetical protein ONZ43_g1126 [Nemania bipapillata]